MKKFFAALFAVFPQALARLYTTDPVVIAMTALLLPIAAVFQVFDGLQVVCAGALRGNDYEAELIRRMAEETGAEAISVAASVREAIRRRGAKCVGVVTPYVDSLNDKIRESLDGDPGWYQQPPGTSVIKVT